jgi:LSD1 subclass zinc finger protein
MIYRNPQLSSSCSLAHDDHTVVATRKTIRQFMSAIRRAESILPFDIYYVEEPDGEVDAMAGASEAFMPRSSFTSHPRGNPRIVCHQCRLLLEYSRGAAYVQCGSCQALNAVLEGTIEGGRTFNMICSACGVSNLAPFGCRFVRCAECRTVSDVSSLYQSRSETHTRNRHTSPVIFRR